MGALPAERLLLPFDGGPFRMAMGLTACPADALLELDEHYAAELAERRALLESRHGDVFAAMPGSEPARAETLAMLAALLVRLHPGWFTQEGNWLHNRLTGERWDLTRPAHDPLELAGRLVQEDLLLVDVSGAAPVLSAAVLCAPSRWLLSEKIGRALVPVHENVPLYGERLGRPVDRFMASLKPGRCAERLNWSVVDSGALFQLGGKFRDAPDPTLSPANAAARLFVRVERQTFARLEAGAVLFAIHVHSYRVDRVMQVPGTAARLAAAVRALPEGLALYKSVPAWRHALLPVLDAAE